MTRCISSILSVTTVLASVLGTGLLVGASPAAAATPYGDIENCSFINSNRLQCSLLALGSTTKLTIQYVAVECGSSQSAAYDLQEVQIGTSPGSGSAAEPYYQIPLTNQKSIGGVVTAASPVTLYAKAGSTPVVLIDLTPAPNQSDTQCHVSISGTT